MTKTTIIAAVVALACTAGVLGLYALALTVISATTVLAFSNLSAAVRALVTSVVGLLP